MTTTTQPEALRLAAELDDTPDFAVDPNMVDEIAAELRSQHARIAELNPAEAALTRILRIVQNYLPPDSNKSERDALSDIIAEVDPWPVSAAPLLQIAEPADPLDDSELEDLAHSANQEALSFGVSLDVFLRLAKTVRLRATALQAAPPAPAAVAQEPNGSAHLPFFSYDEDAGVQFWATQERAIKECQDAIDAYRQDVEDGWPDGVESARWGVVLGRAVKTDERPDHSCDYALTPYAAPAQEHATQLAGQGHTPERQRMTAGRASFFMERFLKEEKLLGPNEQAALHFVIDMLDAAPAQAQEAPVIVTVTQETPLKQNVEFNWAPGALLPGEHKLYLAPQAPEDARPDQRRRVKALLDLLNRRPAMNAGLAQEYAMWNAECYRVMGAQAQRPANDDQVQEDAPAWPLPGDLVRYDSGSSALALHGEPHAGGWHGIQCMGGHTFYLRTERPTDVDRETWARCAVQYRRKSVDEARREAGLEPDAARAAQGDRDEQ